LILKIDENDPVSLITGLNPIILPGKAKELVKKSTDNFNH